jgi:hypothetical protein
MHTSPGCCPCFVHVQKLSTAPLGVLLENVVSALQRDQIVLYKAFQWSLVHDSISSASLKTAPQCISGVKNHRQDIRICQEDCAVTSLNVRAEVVCSNSHVMGLQGIGLNYSATTPTSWPTWEMRNGSFPLWMSTRRG